MYERSVYNTLSVKGRISKEIYKSKFNRVLRPLYLSVRARSYRGVVKSVEETQR